MRILITRPRNDAAQLADRLTSLGHEVLIEPMLEIRTVPNATVDLAGVQAVLFTSANGVRAFALAETRRDLPALAVGNATAAAARGVGFSRVESAGGDAEDLARLVRERLKPQDGVLLHAAGSTLAGDLGGSLAAAGFDVRRAVLYSAEPIETLSPAVAAALAARQIDLVLLFSARTAQTFARVVRKAGLESSLSRAIAVALSPAALEPVKSLPWAAAEAARRPDVSDILSAIPRPVAPAAAEPAAPPPPDQDRFEHRAELPPEPPQPPRVPQAERRRPHSRFMTLLVVLAVVLSLGTFALQTMQSNRPASEFGAAAALHLDSRIAALERQIGQLRSAAGGGETKPADAELPARLARLSDRIAALEAQTQSAAPANGAETEALAGRLSALEQAIATRPEAASPAAFDELAQRVDGLDKALAARPDAGQLAALMAENRRLAADVAHLQEQTAALTAATGERTGREGLLLAVGQLRIAAARGGPVTAELATVRALAGDDPRLGAAIAMIQTVADRKIPTVDDLIVRFPAAADAASRTAGDSLAPRIGGDSKLSEWGNGVLRRLANAVTIRRVGDVPGDAPEARIARADQRISARDLTGAVTALDGLSGPLRDALSGWLADAQARLTLDRGVDDLAATAIAESGSPR